MDPVRARGYWGKGVAQTGVVMGRGGQRGQVDRCAECLMQMQPAMEGYSLNGGEDSLDAAKDPVNVTPSLMKEV